jgi:hypothetical protein
MFCTQCGTRLADGAAFCHVCGTRVAAMDNGDRAAAGVSVRDAEPSTPTLRAEARGAGRGAAGAVGTMCWTKYPAQLWPCADNPGDADPIYLPEGRKVEILERATGGKVRVVTDDGSDGWVTEFVLSRRPIARAAPTGGETPSMGPPLPASGPVSEAVEGGATLMSGCIIYLVANGLLVVSSLLPWETVGALSASGLELGRGWVVLIAALVGLAVAEESLRKGRPIMGLRVAQWASAAAAIGMFVIELAVIGSACSGDENDLSNMLCIQPSLGIGAVLAGIGGLGLGLAAAFRHPR